MFSSSRASLVVLIASAVSIAATPGLTIRTSIPNVNVDGLENLKVTTTITNTGDETLKLLNDPRGALSSFPTNTFSITDSTGSSPLFTGAMVKYRPTYAAGLDDPSVFTVLTPGSSVDVTHDLSTAYNFTHSGVGHYSIEASNLFTYVDSDGTIKTLRATVEEPVEVRLSGNLVASRGAHEKRATYIGCTATRQSQLATAAANAQTYAGNAYSYISSISSGTTRYTTWFGAYTAARKSTVQSHFQLISSRQFSSYTLDCSTCTNAGADGYVLANQYGKVYLCGAYWSAPATGADSKAGTLVHMASHFAANGGTADYATGQTACKNLAVSNPAQAVLNADSHEYFAVLS